MLYPLYQKYKNAITWGDQDLLNIIFYFNPGRFSFKNVVHGGVRPPHPTEHIPAWLVLAEPESCLCPLQRGPCHPPLGVSRGPSSRCQHKRSNVETSNTGLHFSRISFGFCHAILWRSTGKINEWHRSKWKHYNPCTRPSIAWTIARLKGLDSCDPGSEGTRSGLKQCRRGTKNTYPSFFPPGAKKFFKSVIWWTWGRKGDVSFWSAFLYWHLKLNISFFSFIFTRVLLNVIEIKTMFSLWETSLGKKNYSSP